MKVRITGIEMASCTPGGLIGVFFRYADSEGDLREDIQKALTAERNVVLTTDERVKKAQDLIDSLDLGVK